MSDQSKMKIYTGSRNEAIYNGVRGTTLITVSDGAIEYHLVPHFSQYGFEWGYRGRKAYNTAMTVLMDYVKDDPFYKVLLDEGFSELLQKLALKYRRDVISQLPFRIWQLSSDDISDWLQVQEL